MYEITEKDIHRYVLLKTLAGCDLSIGPTLSKLSHIGKDYRTIEKFFDELSSRDPKVAETIDTKSIECVQMVRELINKETAFKLSLSPEEEKLYAKYNQALINVNQKHLEQQIQLPGFTEYITIYIRMKVFADYDKEPLEGDEIQPILEKHIKECKECQELYNASVSAVEVLRKEDDWLNDFEEKKG